jgi:hypothetical protein
MFIWYALFNWIATVFVMHDNITIQQPAITHETTTNHTMIPSQFGGATYTGMYSIMQTSVNMTSTTSDVENIQPSINWIDHGGEKHHQHGMACHNHNNQEGCDWNS